MSPFPPDEFDSRTLEYFPDDPPVGEPVWSVVVFVVLPEGFLIADVRGRGWCTPSGRVEPGETPLEAAVRETVEETGYRPLDLRPAGSFRLTKGDAVSWAAAYVCSQAQEEGPPTGNDSLGRRAVSLGGLPTLYYRWGPFYEAVFARMAGLIKG